MNDVMNDELNADELKCWRMNWNADDMNDVPDDILAKVLEIIIDNILSVNF